MVTDRIRGCVYRGTIVAKRPYDPLGDARRESSALDALTVQRSVLGGLATHQRFLDQLSATSSVSRAVEALTVHQTFAEQFAGSITLNTKIANLSETSAFIEQMKAATDFSDTLAGSVRRMIDQPEFATLIGARKTISQLTQQPDFASMIGSIAMPRVEWASMLEDLREQIGADLADEVVSEFETAADVAEAVEADVWWVARLPVSMQLGLAFVVLQALDKAEVWLGDLTGEDVPPAYRSGIEVLFALLVVLITYIEAREKAADAE